MRYLAQLAYETTARLKPSRVRSWQPAMAPLVEEQVVEWPAGGAPQGASGGEARTHAESAPVAKSPDDPAPHPSRRAAARIEERESDALEMAVEEEALPARAGRTVSRRPSPAIEGDSEVTETKEVAETATSTRQAAARLPALPQAMEPAAMSVEARARQAHVRSEPEEAMSFLGDETPKPRRMERAATSVPQMLEGLSAATVMPERRVEARVAAERVETGSLLERSPAWSREERAMERERLQEATPAPANVTLKEILAMMAERQRELDAQQAREPQARERREIEPGLRQRAPEFELQKLQSAGQEREVRNRTDESAREVNLNIGSIVVRVEPEPVAPPRPAPPPPQPRAYSAPETSNFWARSFLDR